MKNEEDLKDTLEKSGEYKSGGGVVGGFIPSLSVLI